VDLIVKKQIKQMFNDKFVHIITAMTGYFRMQPNLIKAMESNCPRFIDTRWLSMGKLLKWLIDKRIALLQHFDEKTSLHTANGVLDGHSQPV
jgi:hypothetical protein